MFDEISGGSTLTLCVISAIKCLVEVLIGGFLYYLKSKINQLESNHHRLLRNFEKNEISERKAESSEIEVEVKENNTLSSTSSSTDRSSTYLDCNPIESSFVSETKKQFLSKETDEESIHFVKVTKSDDKSLQESIQKIVLRKQKSEFKKLVDIQDEVDEENSQVPTYQIPLSVDKEKEVLTDTSDMAAVTTKNTPSFEEQKEISENMEQNLVEDENKITTKVTFRASSERLDGRVNSSDMVREINLELETLQKNEEKPSVSVIPRYVEKSKEYFLAKLQMTAVGLVSENDKVYLDAKGMVDERKEEEKSISVTKDKDTRSIRNVMKSIEQLEEEINETNRRNSENLANEIASKFTLQYAFGGTSNETAKKETAQKTNKQELRVTFRNI
ncbi:uncharacterized protein LOC111628375 [Centruroides sculpturatus]|uniref:uncharacterized protein LOC111628375 n=1 Tax=Centruroides sculpturatus TaxID=218467 RepID=UPI000C6C90D6|nr:uncharacterized protein LOC111628375 [Centruroides sculpturatus]